MTVAAPPPLSRHTAVREYVRRATDVAFENTLMSSDVRPTNRNEAIPGNSVPDWSIESRANGVDFSTPVKSTAALARVRE